jgi:hypothetical protein
VGGGEVLSNSARELDADERNDEQRNRQRRNATGEP